MTLFLSPRDPDGQHQWLRVCDFAQVCTLVLCVGVIADLRSLSVAGCGSGDGDPNGACGDLFLRTDCFEFYRPFAARGESRGEELLRASGLLFNSLCLCGHGNPLLSGFGTLQAGRMVRPAVDDHVRITHSSVGDVGSMPGRGRERKPAALPRPATSGAVRSAADTSNRVSDGAGHRPRTVRVGHRTRAGFFRGGGWSDVRRAKPVSRQFAGITEESGTAPRHHGKHARRSIREGSRIAVRNDQPGRCSIRRHEPR